MDLSKGIRNLGFRGWYERQLIEAHLYLVSGLLCLIAVVASVEEFGTRLPAWEFLLRLATTAGGSALCLWTLRRYLMMLDYAEYAAGRSVCGKCAAYGGLELLAAARAETTEGEEHARATPVGVRCRKCGHEWFIG